MLTNHTDSDFLESDLLNEVDPVFRNGLNYVFTNCVTFRSDLLNESFDPANKTSPN